MDNGNLLIRRRNLMMKTSSKERDWSREPLTIIARENCNIQGYSYYADNSPVETGVIKISINHGSLVDVYTGTGDWKKNSNGEEITLNAGDEMAVYSDGNFYTEFEDIYETQYGTFDLAGNIMSLRYGQDFLNHSEFGNKNLPLDTSGGTGMFGKCPQIVSTENLILPATTLYANMYRNMFQECQNLEYAPAVLPATTLASSCYSGMFYHCPKLTKSPKILALNLTTSCYASMFQYCSSLNEVYAMFLTTPQSSTRAPSRNWLNGVSSTGTFYKNKNATWTARGVYAVPNNWDIVLVDPE